MIRTVKIASLVVGLMLAFAGKPTTAFSSEKMDQKINQLLAVTGSTARMEDNIRKAGLTLSSSLKKSNPSVPADVIDKSGKRYSEILMKLMLGENGLQQRQATVYKRYYSEKDIDRYLQFYRSKSWRHISENKGNVSKGESEKVKKEYLKLVEATGGAAKQDAIKRDVRTTTDTFVNASLGSAQKDLNRYLKTLGYKLEKDKLVKL